MRVNCSLFAAWIQTESISLYCENMAEIYSGENIIKVKVSQNFGHWIQMSIWPGCDGIMLKAPHQTTQRAGKKGKEAATHRDCSGTIQWRPWMCVMKICSQYFFSGVACTKTECYSLTIIYVPPNMKRDYSLGYFTQDSGHNKQNSKE